MRRGPLYGRSSRSLLALVAVVMVAVAGTYLYFQVDMAPKGTGSSSNTETTSVSAPSAPVRDAVNEFFQDFNQRSVNGLLSLYYSGANVIWSGNAPGLTGGYSGSYAIMILYGSTVGKMTQVTTRTTNYVERYSSPTDVNVTLTLMLNGTSTVAGRLNGTINVSQEWAYSGGQWEIVRENWNYKAFDVEFPSSATTFPQWGVLKEGKNPAIVSEKSFEWNAGPAVAGGVYAFLVGIVLFYVRRGREARVN